MRARILAGILAAAAIAGAQVRLDLNDPQQRKAVEAFRGIWTEKIQDAKLDCRIQHGPARVGFDFTAWAGFELEMSAEQFADQSHSVVFVYRVTPDGPKREPAYFGHRANLSEVPKNINAKKSAFRFFGAFLMGEGEYQVDLLAVDTNQPRSCRASWKLKAKAPKGVQLRLGAGEVDDGSTLFDRRREPLVAQQRPGTILLNAYPVTWRRHMIGLSGIDRRMLIANLRAVVEAAHFSPARVVVFDLRRRKLVFESENFDRTEYRRLMQAFAGVDLGTIDYSTLASEETEWEFLHSLAQREAERQEMSRALVFIGSGLPAPYKKKRGPRVEDLRETLPKPYLLSLLPGQIPMDLVSEFVKALRGKVLNVNTPADLMSAIKRMADGLNSE